MVDVATLTGAMRRGARPHHAALFGTPQPWVDICASGRAGRGKIWPMPLFEEYKEQLKSEIADMLNIAGRPAGAITAALFLKEFGGGCRGPTSTSPGPRGSKRRSPAAEGRHRRRDAHAGGAGGHGVPLAGCDSLRFVASGSPAAASRPRRGAGG